MESRYLSFFYFEFFGFVAEIEFSFSNVVNIDGINCRIILLIFVAVILLDDVLTLIDVKFSSVRLILFIAIVIFHMVIGLICYEPKIWSRSWFLVLIFKLELLLIVVKFLLDLFKLLFFFFQQLKPFCYLIINVK